MTTTTVNLTECDSADLLAELHRRGTFSRLHGAIGALYDHLSNSGAMDGDSPMVSYLVCRLRREEAATSGAPDATKTASFWNDKIAALG